MICPSSKNCLAFKYCIFNFRSSFGSVKATEVNKAIVKSKFFYCWSKHLKMHFTDCNKILTLVGAKSQLDTSGKYFQNWGTKMCFCTYLSLGSWGLMYQLINLFWLLTIFTWINVRAVCVCVGAIYPWLSAKTETSYKHNKSAQFAFYTVVMQILSWKLVQKVCSFEYFGYFQFFKIFL